uniref:Uncharacterized protein n=1 Tax=Setaria italica TaxID=4555 RepID=K3Y077_SETIT
MSCLHLGSMLIKVSVTTIAIPFLQLFYRLQQLCVLLRSHPSPNKKIAKKLFTGEETGDGSGGSGSGAATSDQNSPSKGCMSSEAHVDFVSYQLRPTFVCPLSPVRRV